MSPHRAGFITLIGRPNVGKSTLLNRLLGEKLAIVSPRPQATRTRVTGIRTGPDAQMIFVDTPGLHEPRGKLGQLMVNTVHRALEGVDVVCLVAEATEDPLRLDEQLFKAVVAVSGAAFCCLNKVDLAEPKERVLPLIEAYHARYPFREIIPISATDGTNCDRLLALVQDALPEHPPFFPPDTLTDQPETFYVAEVIRESLFLLTREEVPYACAVRVEEVAEREGKELLYIRAMIFVEQDSQKAIVIGSGGAMLKRIGTTARRKLEGFFGIRVFLELRVEVRKNWRKDEHALREFGFMLTS
ncbi:MAG: GTPase Era [Candidatus Methylomirabilia bacterium]